jgi:hypothetical protein
VLATTTECAFRPYLTITTAVRIHRLFASFDCKYLLFSHSTQFTIDRVEKDANFAMAWSSLPVPFTSLVVADDSESTNAAPKRKIAPDPAR